MSEKEKVKSLAGLLATVAGVKDKDNVDPQDTITNAVEKLKDDKAIDPSVVDQLEDADVINEDIGEIEPNKKPDQYELDWFKWIIRKFNGEGCDDNQNWYGTLFNYSRLGKGNDDSFRNARETVDTDKDDEQGISYDDIEQYFKGISAEDYASLYTPDDFDFTSEDVEDYLEDIDDDLEDEDDEDKKDNYSKLQADIDEFPWEEQVDEYGNLLEALDVQQRMARKILMKRLAKRIAAKRKIALKRHANIDTLKKRARKLALRMLKKKYAGDKTVDEMSFGERKRVEELIAKKQPVVDRLQIKLLPVVRNLEAKRFASAVEKAENEQAV